MREKSFVEATGVWLRTAGGESNPGRIQMLVEVAGTWRLVADWAAYVPLPPISHIVEPAGIVQAPHDTIAERVDG